MISRPVVGGAARWAASASRTAHFSAKQCAQAVSAAVVAKTTRPRIVGEIGEQMRIARVVVLSFGQCEHLTDHRNQDHENERLL